MRVVRRPRLIRVVPPSPARPSAVIEVGPTREPSKRGVPRAQRRSGDMQVVVACQVMGEVGKVAVSAYVGAHRGDVVESGRIWMKGEGRVSGARVRKRPRRSWRRGRAQTSPTRARPCLPDLIELYGGTRHEKEVGVSPLVWTCARFAVTGDLMKWRVPPPSSLRHGALLGDVALHSLHSPSNARTL
jgi:hypothetical protein